MSKLIKEFPTLFKRTAGGETQIWRIWVTENPGGIGCLNIEYGHQGGKLQQSQEDIREGKNAGKKNATSPVSQALTEAESRWEMKQSRKGYALEVGASAKIRSVSPMLAHVYAKHAKKIDWSRAFAQKKYDGFRALVRQAGKDVSITSRENQPLNAVSHIADILKRVGLPESLTLDGELYCHGLALNQISSACKKKSDITDQIEYHVYDCFSTDSPDLSFKARYERLRTELADLFSHEKIVLVETVKVADEAELMAAQAEFLEQGYEGAMLRHGTAGYEAGKRSDSLLKVKTFSDAEFKIVDFKMGRGKYAGIPIFTCETEAGHPFDVTAPGTIAEKRALGEAAEDQLGKMITVRYIYMTKTAAPVPFLPVAKVIHD